MPDCSSADIKIGGQLKRADLGRLAKAIVDERVGPDYDDVIDTTYGAGKAIMAAAEAGTPLFLCDNEASGGQFEDLEGVLDELGLSYVRADDGHYTWTPTVVLHLVREAGAVDREWVGTVDDHEPQLNMKQVRELTEKGDLAAEVALMDVAADFKLPLVIVD